MTQLVIEKNVPIPDETRGRPGTYKAVAMCMEIGDSVVVPEKNSKSFYSVARKCRIRVLRRTCADGIRFWRVE